MFSSRRNRKKGETIEHFSSILKELTENCDLENREEAIIRDNFISNLLNDDIQRELLHDTVVPDETLSIAVNMEMGQQKQQQISSNNNNNNNNAIGNAINAIQSFNRFRGVNARVNQSGRISFN